MSRLLKLFDLAAVRSHLAGIADGSLRGRATRRRLLVRSKHGARLIPCRIIDPVRIRERGGSASGEGL